MEKGRWITMVVIAVLILTAIVLLIWTAGDDKRTTKAVRPTEEPTYAPIDPGLSGANSVETGRRLYRRYCMTCHGKEGRGKGPASQQLSVAPLNFHGDTAANYSNKQLFERITHGKQSSGMPAWEGRLSRKQRWAIVDYLNPAFIKNRLDSPPIR